ncbi:hypothetical protein Tco_0678044 [Tanacetum coccineum]|uniref:Uncharacterized protein n=1 Tax=Tanacetum coccineum TaxID=301880 RepID=A0ABQ4XDV8_9ASTR
MAASAIAISSDSSDESVGSPPSQVILFGDIPTVILSTSVVAPETSTIAPVISSAAHVVEMTLSLHPLDCVVWFPIWVSILALDGPPSQDPYVMTVARWRSKVSSPPSSSYVFPIAPVTVPPEIRRRPVILIRLGEAIPFGRPYCTHLNGPRKLLTARKRVGPLPARRLAWRHASPRSSDHHPSYSSSSLDSSPVHSSGLDAPNQAHSGSLTRDVSPRLGYPSRRAPRRSEAFRRWCAASLSTLYPPTTSESSSGDSSERPLHSSSHSAGPSRKRCRSPVDFVPSSTPVMGSLAPTRADLLPPHKRFKDSYSSEASKKEIQDVDTEEYEALKTSAGDLVEIGSRLDCFQRLEADQLMARRQRVSMIERIESLRLENFKVHAMLDIERDRVNSLRLYMSLSQEEFRQVCRDRDDTRGRLRRLESTMTNTRSGMTPAAIEEMINQRVDAALEARRVNRDLELGNGNDNGGGDGNGNGTGNGNNGGDNTVTDIMKWSTLNVLTREPIELMLATLYSCDREAVEVPRTYHDVYQNGPRGGGSGGEISDGLPDVYQWELMCKLYYEGQCTAKVYITVSDWTSGAGIADLL